MEKEYYEELNAITKHEIELEAGFECNLEYNCQCEDCKDARLQIIVDRYV
jgi:hypothetical protein